MYTNRRRFRFSGKHKTLHA